MSVVCARDRTGHVGHGPRSTLSEIGIQLYLANHTAVNTCRLVLNFPFIVVSPERMLNAESQFQNFIDFRTL